MRPYFFSCFLVIEEWHLKHYGAVANPKEQTLLVDHAMITNNSFCTLQQTRTMSPSNATRSPSV